MPKQALSGMIGDVNHIQLNKFIGNVNKTGMLSTTIGSNVYYVPASMIELGSPDEITLADVSNDDLTLGTTIACTGNTVQAVLPDVGGATLLRRSCVINGSDGTILVTWTDEGNTTINGQAKRLSITKGGYVVIQEKANDTLLINEGHGVSMVAFA